MQASMEAQHPTAGDNMGPKVRLAEKTHVTMSLTA
jgi:hypothetical protein